MNSTGDNGLRRNQLFASFAGLPPPNGAGLQTGDEVFALLEGQWFKLSGAIGARFWQPSSLTPGSGAVQLFVFTPGAPQSGNVFGDWAQLCAVLATLPIGENPVVRFTASFVIPAIGMPVGGWDMRGGTWESFSRQTGLVVVTIGNLPPVQIHNLAGISNSLVLDVFPTLPDPMLTFPASTIGGAQVFVVGFGSVLNHTFSGGAFIQSPGVLGTPTTMVIAWQDCDQFLAGPLTGAIVKLNGNDSAVCESATAQLGGCPPDNWLDGGGLTSSLLDIRGLYTRTYFIPTFVGGGGTTVLNAADPRNVPYTTLAPANWAGVPANLAEAIDRLAAAVSGLLGGLIP